MSCGRPGIVPADGLAPPLDQDIRDQLARIRSSPAFDAPDRAQKFLSYVVEEALQGRADRIKAYSVALEVFGRDASFDAQNDPVVRIEAGRVRRALEHYYLIAGQDDPILITIPKGGYVPTFTRLNAQVPKAAEALSKQGPRRKADVRMLGLCAAAILLVGVAGWAALNGPALERLVAAGGGSAGNTVPEMPRVVVDPFEDITGTPGSSLLARGLTDEVIGQMARFKEIKVVAGAAPAQVAERPTAVPALPQYGLEGRVRVDQDRFRLSARLVNQHDGAVIWTKAYDAQIGERELLDIETDIASDIAASLAQPYGVIFQADASALAHVPTKDARAYACALSYYGYRADLKRQTHAAVQGCLKDVVVDFPSYATAWALLSLTYLDELRFRYRFNAPDRPEDPPPLELAREAAERAVGLDPGNVRALQAEMLASYFNGDVRNALAIGERAFAINPNDSEFAGEFGFRLALAGQWDRGCRMVSRSVARNPGPTDYFQSALSVCSYMSGDYQEAERWARTSNLKDNPIFHLILAAIYGQRGKMAEARIEKEWLERHAPEYLRDPRKEVATRILRTEDQNHFIEGLRKAGVDVTPAGASSPPALKSEAPQVAPHASPG